VIHITLERASLVLEVFNVASALCKLCFPFDVERFDLSQLSTWDHETKTFQVWAARARSYTPYRRIPNGSQDLVLRSFFILQ
jgi:hypothetical protein